MEFSEVEMSRPRPNLDVVWHDVIMQLLAKGEMVTCFRACGIDKCTPEGSGSDLPFCGIFEPVAFSNSSDAGIRGGRGTLPLDCCASDRRAIA
jgi:hypothetical protein